MSGKWKIAQIVLILFTLLSISSSYAHNGHSFSFQRIATVEVSPQAGSVSEINSTSIYITANLTVRRNETLKFENESIIIENMTSKLLKILVYGDLLICNSSISISSAYSSSVSQVFIHGEPGSRITIENSMIKVSGGIYLNNSQLEVNNSSLSSDNSSNTNPYRETLRFVVSHSYVMIVNSSLSGLLHYSQNCIFQVATWNSTIANFSQNSTVPLNRSNIADTNAYVVSGKISLQYFGNKVENNDYLKVSVRNSSVGYVRLNVSHPQQKMSANLSFSLQTFHIPEWFQDGNNFKVDLINHFSNPVAVSNLSVSLFSNDTVSLYPRSMFNYVIYNSTLIVVNSNVDINEANRFLDGCIINPQKNSVLANQSRIYWISSTINQSYRYRDSPFINIRSKIYLFRYMEISGKWENRSIANFNPAITEQSPSLRNITDLINSRTAAILEEHGIFSSGRILALFAVSNQSQNFAYTGDYLVRFGNSSMEVSLPPFPFFDLKVIHYVFRAKVPSIVIEISHVKLVSGGNSTLDFNTIISGGKIFNSTITVELRGSNGSSYCYDFHTMEMTSGHHSEYMLLEPTVLPGNYTVLVEFSASVPFITKTSNPVMVSSYVFPDLSLRISGNATEENSQLFLRLHISKTGIFNLSSVSLKISVYNCGTLIRTAEFPVVLGKNFYNYTLATTTAAITEVNATVLTPVTLMNQSRNCTYVVLQVFHLQGHSNIMPLRIWEYTPVLVSAILSAVAGSYFCRRYVHTYYVCRNCGSTHRGRWAKCTCDEKGKNEPNDHGVNKF